jgi:RimJ/RimL family protein N-acetyltransferase
MTVSGLFQGERVQLTSITPEDAPTMARWYEDGAFGRLWDADTSRPRSEGQIRDWFNETAQNKSAFAFAIRLKDTRELIGYLDIDSIIWNNGVAWISLAIGEPAQRGKGYGEEAMRLALKFAFHEINLHRLQLTVFEYNDRAIRLYERLGFVREGTYREFLNRDGQRYDMYLYGLLRREWEEKI